MNGSNLMMFLGNQSFGMDISGRKSGLEFRWSDRKNLSDRQWLRTGVRTRIGFRPMVDFGFYEAGKYPVVILLLFIIRSYSWWQKCPGIPCFLIQWALSMSQCGSACGLRGVLCWQRPCCNNNATQNICILLTCHFFSKNRFWYFWRFFDDLQKANRSGVKWSQLFYQAIIEFRRTLTRY